MEHVNSRTDYGPAVIATFLWAGVGAFLAASAGLLLLVLGLFSLAGCLWMTEPTGPMALSLVCSVLGGLVLYAVVRSTSLSVVRVWRSPGYPERHWWFVRRAFRRIFRTELILLAAVSGAIHMACRSDGVVADRADMAVGVTGALFVFYQLVAVASLNDILRHAAVVPYFRRCVGEISTFCSGESLARHVDELDELAIANAVTPLSSFGWNDDFEGGRVVWHASAEGLKSVNFLLLALEREETGWDDRAATIADLKKIAHALERADAAGITFSFLLRHSTATNGQEWDARQGTCG